MDDAPAPGDRRRAGRSGGCVPARLGSVRTGLKVWFIGRGAQGRLEVVGGRRLKRAGASRWGVGLVAACALLLGAATDATAGASSLYGGPGPRPGPDILYAPAPQAPQLQNAGPWRASPILVSGAEAA